MRVLSLHRQPSGGERVLPRIIRLPSAALPNPAAQEVGDGLPDDAARHSRRWREDDRARDGRVFERRPHGRSHGRGEHAGLSGLEQDRGGSPSTSPVVDPGVDGNPHTKAAYARGLVRGGPWHQGRKPGSQRRLDSLARAGREIAFVGLAPGGRGCRPGAGSSRYPKAPRPFPCSFDPPTGAPPVAAPVPQSVPLHCRDQSFSPVLAKIHV